MIETALFGRRNPKKEGKKLKCYMGDTGLLLRQTAATRQPSDAMRFIFTSGLFQDSSLCS